MLFRKYTSLWISVLVLFVAIIGCSGSDNGTVQIKSSKKAVVKTIQANRTSIAQVVEITGSIEPFRIARLASPAEGPVLQLKVREGDNVIKDQLLLIIGRSEGAIAAVKALQQEVNKEEEELRRIERLVKIGALPEDQLDQCKANYEGARSKLINVEQSAQDYQIKSPWNGLISSVTVTEGHYVNPRTMLLEMYDPQSLVVRLALPEIYALTAHKGTEFLLLLDAYPDKKFHAKINRVFPQLDPTTRTRNIEAIIVDSIETVPGMFLRAFYPVKSVDSAIVVPDRAVLTKADGKKFVFIANNGKAILSPISTGIEQGQFIQIVDGIKEGELVIVDGNEHLKNGSSLKIINAKDSISPEKKSTENSK